jgi:hypothetical protein
VSQTRGIFIFRNNKQEKVSEKQRTNLHARGKFCKKIAPSYCLRGCIYFKCQTSSVGVFIVIMIKKDVLTKKITVFFQIQIIPN